MNNTKKKNLIKRHVKIMMRDSQKHMMEKLEKVLVSGCIDLENWDAENAPMIVPKAIMCALLDNEHFQYAPPKTIASYKQWKKEKRNITYFI